VVGRVTSDRWGRVFVGLAVAASGCGRVGEAIQNRVQAEFEARVLSDDAHMPGTLAPPDLGDQDRLADKLSLYHECLRRTRGHVVESYERWTQGIDLKTGGPKRNGARPLVYPVDGDLQPCRRATDEGPLREPSLPAIEAAMQQYLTALTAFAALAVTLDAYYGAEAFKEDAWVKGKELAPQFISAWVAWEQARDGLSGELEEVRDGLDELRLAQAGAQEGPSMRWHCHRAMLAAKGFERCTRRDPLAAGMCDGALTTFDGRLAELEAYAEGHDAEADRVFWWPSYDAALRDFAEDAHAATDLLRSKKFTGDLDALRDHHDEVRAAFDNLRFDLAR
jgi:hypothetical protein